MNDSDIRRRSLAAAIATGLFALALNAGADSLPGEAKAYPCTACHGPDGMKSAPGQPAIGGRPAEDLVAILEDYRHLRRVNPAMQVLLLSMSDEDVEDIAEYFSLNAPPARAAEVR